MHPGPPDSQTVLNALKGPCLEGVAKLKLPPSQDVPEVNRSVRESLTRNMRRLKTGRSDGPALIQPLVGQAGSGKTHILSWLRGETLREGGFFIAADLTASNKDLFLSLNRAAEDSLTYDTGEERSQLGRLLDNLVAEAGVAKSLGGLGSRLPLPQPEAASALAAVSAGLLRKHMSEALRYKTVIESVFLLASAEQDDIYSAHAFFCTPKPTSLEAFGGLTWLMSLGSFTVLAMDQLDAIVSNLRTDEANKTRRDLVHDLSIDMGSIHDHAFRTLPVLTLLEEAWQYLTNVALLSSLGRFEHESTLSPVNDAALLERIVALRLKEAYDEIGFTPEYPSWPFPRAFFEANEGKFPRELLKACRKHVKDCTVFRRAVPWPIIEDAGEPQVPPPAKGDVEAGRREELLAEMDAMFADVLKDFPPVAEKAFWDRTVLTYLECLALEDPAAEAAGVTVDSRSGVLPIGRYATVTTAPPGPELILTVVTALGNHGTRYCTILDDALRRSGVQKDLPERRLAVVRPGGTRLPGPRTQSHEAYAKLLQAGGRLAFPTPEDETELFALSEVRNRYPNSFQEWAVSRRPAGRIKLLKEELDWLLKSSVTVHGPASVTTPRAGNAPPATPQAGSPPPGEPKPGNAPPAAPQAESPSPSGPKPGNAPPATPQAGS
ncbi:MAG: hypothetical protein LBT40_11680, partial [Deltaproteobacteria bacterium]|nr:hypothetical protein [Deltaproteobacteria bacterium]